MGNTKSYYIEGTVKPGLSVELVKGSLRQCFRATYCVVEFVEPEGGYLGQGTEGPYALAALHSSSLSADGGVRFLSELFSEFTLHRFDEDLEDVWIVVFDGMNYQHWTSGVVFRPVTVDPPDREERA